MNHGLAALADLVHREAGITMTAAQETSLRAALGRAAPGLDVDAFLQQTNHPLEGRPMVQRLIDEVTVKETMFLRDREQLATIDWENLRRVAAAAGSSRIRVWSAGCATGEEPYTLAMLAVEAFAPHDPPVDILGTDISSAAVMAARHGLFRERSVRELDPERRNRYFSIQNGDYLVGDQLRRHVRLERHNLTRDPIPPLGELSFDLVVCRNVLIYFDVHTVERILSSFERCVVQSGSLLIGHADALCGSATRLTQRAVERRKPKAPRATIAQRLRRSHVRPEQSRDELLTAALAAADSGKTEEALEHSNRLLSADPLDADAYFVRGLVELESGAAGEAAATLRRALYVDPTFALAAFTLGRAHDALGDIDSARRAYAQALRSIHPSDERHELLLQQVDLNDIAAACRARLAVMG